MTLLKSSYFLRFALRNLNYQASLSETKNIIALKKEDNDLSEITPHISSSFNLASYVNDSQILKALVHLDVNLSKIERKQHIVHKLLKIDFEKDFHQHIMFLKDFVCSDDIGNFITKNPLILCEDLDNLKVRLNYLQSKRFSLDGIESIIARNPFWLMYSTERIDRRLGHFQKVYKLTGNEIRYLATKSPKLITYNLVHVRLNTFAIKEEMGFDDEEVKHLLLDKPNVYMISQKSLLNRFNFIHNIMKFPHEVLLKYPKAFLCREFLMKQRHTFLKSIGRAQYDPKLENFISLKAIVESNDIEFCENFAKCSLQDFNDFLKTI